MEIKNRSDLEGAIDRLKKQEKLQKEMLVENFHTTYEGLKPMNLIKKSISKLLHTPEVKHNVVNAGVGLGAGLLSKKLLIGKPTNILKRMIGVALEAGVAGAVTKNSDIIKIKGARLLSKLWKSKRPESPF